MKIVVLDGFTLNPGDLSWDAFEQIGELTVHDRTPEHLVVERASGADIVLTNKTPVSAETLSRLPELKYIGVLATGYNIVDVEAAAARGIPVTNVPDYGTGSVAQLVFALLLELCHHVGEHSEAVFGGEWSASPDFCFTKRPLYDLQGKTMGIVGFGRIGQQVARIADVFGMKVAAAVRTPKQLPGLEFVKRSGMAEVLAESDVVSLHCPLTAETMELIRTENIALMKRSAFLINTSRGGLVHEADLAAALNEGRIAGAGLDVLSTEPPKPDNPLLHARNCVITPHIAWATQEARTRLMRVASDNLRGFLAGRIVNAVNMSRA